MAQPAHAKLMTSIARLRPEGRPRFTVIVAEDDDEMRRMLVEWLEAIGASVIECRDGHVLVEWMLKASSSQLSHVDLIVTDERMPRSNGLEALESLWFMPLPPVLIITAYGDTRLWSRARGLGNVGVLPKPFGRRALREAVSKLVPSLGAARVP